MQRRGCRGFALINVHRNVIGAATYRTNDGEGQKKTRGMQKRAPPFPNASGTNRSNNKFILSFEGKRVIRVTKIDKNVRKAMHLTVSIAYS